MSAPSRGQKRRSPFKAVSRWWRAWAKGRAALSDLKCCGEIEVERIANEVGMSASELRRLVSGPEEADLLLLRMAALGLDRNEVSRTEPRTFQDLQRVCGMCESHRRCARDLARDSANPRWEDYCPNAVTLMALNAILVNAGHTNNVSVRKTHIKTARIWEWGR
jgi:hypothetical protein